MATSPVLSQPSGVKDSGERASSRRSLTRAEAPVTRRRKGGPRSPKTINNVLATLRTILHLASDYDLIDRIPRIPFEADVKKDPVFLDFHEADAFLAAAPAEWHLLLRTALRTGLRRGEILELRWRDLHLAAQSPHVRVSRAMTPVATTARVTAGSTRWLSRSRMPPPP